MDFTRRIEIDTEYDEAVERVRGARKEQGFGVLTEAALDMLRTQP